MVSVEAVKAGVMNYFEHEFCEKATGLGQFASYFMLPSVPGIVDKFIDRFQMNELMSDIFHDGRVDIDEAEIRAKSAMERCGNIEFMGFKLNTNDVTELAACIRRA